ncbi:hypothetical protein C9415_10310 [Kluyvera sp. Nf5]|nr:hypothetical protein C9415_10310 [Kluyvera sp. Nf5]
MKWLHESILKLSMWSAERLYGARVTQVDVWFDGGRKVCLMTADEQRKLIRVAKELNQNWTQKEKDELQEAIKRIRSEEING